MAEILLRSELAAAGLDRAVTVDSAGTGDWHLGQRMDAHAGAELARRGYDGSAHRARQIEPSWLAGRDLILAMDGHNLADLRRMAARAGVDAARVRLFGEAGGLPSSTAAGQDIPDPYGGGPGDFSAVLDLIEAAARQITAQLAELLAGRAPA
jgi:protein-tyrosine phosphatase